MEVEPAVRRHLLNDQAVRGYVGDRVYKQHLDEHVQGAGKRAIVLRVDGGWSQPDTVQTSEFPLLYIDFWADRSRDSTGRAVADDAMDNARAVYRVTDPLLHARRGERWGSFGTHRGLMVVSSARWSEPIVQTEMRSHGGTFLGVKLGDCAVVTAAYALHVLH
ncbi:hypothetical protein ACFXGA_06130 [Actinosynnema sp. NPDC059335]|uniref:hypothetical protein n=1 Tax=Actinosynnema sp. NPDC059335 TaxID=3346804 RepID=UPI00366C00D9